MGSASGETVAAIAIKAVGRLLLGFLASSSIAVTFPAPTDHPGLRDMPLNFRLSETPGWHRIAIVEVPDNTCDFPQRVRDDALRFEVRLADASPPGLLWYGIFTDPSYGARYVARTAWAVLTALKNSSEAGVLEGFRIVNGEQWLAPGGNHAQGADDRTPRDTAFA